MAAIHRILPRASAFAVFTLMLLPGSASAADRLCDPGGEDCRSILINLIRNEQAGIDVAFWFMEDARYTTELIRKWQAGVPVRVIVDSRANSSYPLNAQRLAELRNAGIPMRERFTGGILHWKMMLFVGQNTVQFSGANYSADAWLPTPGTEPYTSYVDEAIFFTDQASVVNSFKTKYDDLWVNTTAYRNYANITGTLTREYGIYTKDPELNFPPSESYANRAVSRYNAETQQIDVIMYRITDRRHSDAMIAAHQRGVPVRLITEPEQYRDPTRYWHAWNVDRMYVAGIQIKHRAHAGLNHQKSVLLHGLGLTIFGSSNWTSASAASQEEHNYFTADAAIFRWFEQQFDRKWNNLAGVTENTPFVPLPPDTPKTPSPANGATGVSTSVTLKWNGGYWAHIYDVYFGTTSNPPLYAANLELGPNTRSLTIPTALASATTYYWKIVGKTMANLTRTSPVWTFTTTGTSTPPPDPGAGDIVLYAADPATINGAWRRVSDSTAAAGVRLHHPNAGAAKLTAALASPTNYFEMTFNAVAGTAYRLWMRGKADSNSWANDSAFVQFSGSVNANGTAQWRIGTTSATEYNLEDCSGCGLSGWGWQDNGWGVGVLGPPIYFATTGTQRIRIQTREDGLSIDQIVLSPSTYISRAPGALKNDTTIVRKP